MKKVTKALHKLGDLSIVNQAEGKFAILTTKHRREIKQAVEVALDAKKEIIFEERRRPTKSPSIHNHHYTITNHHHHVYEQPSPAITKLVGMLVSTRAKDLQSVEIKLNFKDSEDRSAGHRSGLAKTTNTIIPSARRESSRQASRRSGPAINDHVPSLPRLPSARSRPHGHQLAIGPPPPGSNANVRSSSHHQGAQRTRTTKP